MKVQTETLSKKTIKLLAEIEAVDLRDNHTVHEFGGGYIQIAIDKTKTWDKSPEYQEIVRRKWAKDPTIKLESLPKNGTGSWQVRVGNSWIPELYYYRPAKEAA